MLNLKAFALAALTMGGARAADLGTADLRFPADFKWCVATAAHQIEGDNVNSDWWRWEQQPGKIKTGEPSGLATDSWRRWREDLELIRNLNANQYRFSIEWAKVEPRPGEWDQAALDHYRLQLVTMRQMEIQPLVTLHHFTSPQWFAEIGGWTSPQAPELFERYVRKVVAELGGEVRQWITFNEPTVFLLAGYVDGAFPPGIHAGIGDIVDPMRVVLQSHARAYRSIHQIAPQAQVGIAHHLRVFQPKWPWNPLDAWAATVVDRAFNWAFVEALETGRMRLYLPLSANVDEEIPGLAHSQDFLGVNYYTRDMVSFNWNTANKISLSVHEGSPESDLNWEIYPDGFAQIVRKVARLVPGKDIYITENGIADANDAQRPAFLHDHLAALLRAIRQGAPVKGYCHWSLLDNYEWAEGFKPRFGLYAVDRVTLNRTMRDSGRYFAEIAGQNQSRLEAER